MATQASLNFAQELYVAYYGRPADPAGLEYWAERADQEGQGAILNAFGTSQEFTEQYGSLDDQALVNSLYQQLFSRDADPVGLEFYTDLLASGERSLSEIAVSIKDGALGADQEIIENKVEVAQYYTQNAESYDYAQAKSLVAGIDGDTSQEEIETIIAEIDTSAGEGDAPADEEGEEASPDTGSDAPVGGEPTDPTTPTPPVVDDNDDETETPPVEEEPTVPVLTEEQILTVQGGAEADTFISPEELAEYEAVRFSGINDAEITVEGLGNKWVLVEDSTMVLNLNETESGQVRLENSSVTLWGDTDVEDPEAEELVYEPTGMMTSLTVAVVSNSSLDLSSSATEGLAEVILAGSGSLTLTGNSLVAGASVNASAMTGSLSIADGVIDNAASVIAGRGDDDLVVGTLGVVDEADFSSTSTIDLVGGEGADTLTVTDGMTVTRKLDGEGNDLNSGLTVSASVSGFETVNFGGYVEVDAQDFSGVNSFTFASGGSINNVTGQTVTATAGDVDGVGSPLILRDAGDTVNVAANFEARNEVLDLRVYDDSEEGTGTGGTLNLSGSGAIAYEESGRQFDTVDSSELSGGLEFTGADYVQENVTLGTGADTLNVAGSSIYGSVGNRIDSITGFDASNDTLDIGDLGALNAADVSTAASLEGAFEAAAMQSGGDYVAFEFGESTYIYADTEADPATDTSASTEGVSYNDFAIELVGVQGELAPLDGTTAPA